MSVYVVTTTGRTNLLLVVLPKGRYLKKQIELEVYHLDLNKHTIVQTKHDCYHLILRLKFVRFSAQPRYMIHKWFVWIFLNGAVID